MSSMWAVGYRSMIGQKVFREYWSNYFQHTNALIYVIDAADEKRLMESGSELINLLKNEELSGVPLLIFANKQDMVSALDSDEIVEKLCLGDITNRQWTIMACSAVKGEGLSEGLDWIVNVVSSKQN